MIFTSAWPSVGPFPEMTIAQFIISNPYKVDPDKVIILEGGGSRSLTFQDYCDAIVDSASGVAAAFSQLQRGDVVGVLSTNTLEMPALALGICGAGFVPAMVPPASTPSEIAHSLKLVDPLGPRVVFVHPALVAGLKEGIATCNFPRTPILVTMLPSSLGLISLQEVIAKGRQNRRPLCDLTAPAAKTLAMTFYSSGTTGPFKGVQLSHTNLIANAKQMVVTSPETFRQSSTMLSFLPLYHSYGLCSTILGAPLSGTKSVHLEKFEPELFLSEIQKHKVTNIAIVPPVALFLAKHPLVDKYDLSSLQSLGIAAAPTKKELMHQLRRRLNVKVTQGYGMTEASPGTHQLMPSLEIEGEGSVGQLFPDMEARIVNSEGKDVGNDEEGEIVLRGPNIMLGYINNEKATREAVREGWLFTGDVGYRNKDGHYWIVDRLKELIKVRGFQVAPAELEGILLSLPMVLDCAVTAFYDDDKATEFPRAFVVVDPKTPRTAATAKEIRSLVDAQVAHYKWLVGGVHFLDEIPKNGSGKIMRRLLPKTVEAPKIQAKL